MREFHIYRMRIPVLLEFEIAILRRKISMWESWLKPWFLRSSAATLTAILSCAAT